MIVTLLSGGAAFGLIEGIRDGFEKENACRIEGEFGAVGLMKDKLLSGADCDVVILSRKLIDDLAHSGAIDSNTIQNLGLVSTGIALKAHQEKVAVGTVDDFKQALLAAEKIFVPDMEKSTAGLHMKRVFHDLGLYDAIRPKIAEHPNGAAAMKAMADEPGARLIGCTQATEILYTKGVDLIGMLPPGCELDTMYTIATAIHSAHAQLAQKLTAVLTDEMLREFKGANGFRI